MSLQPPNTKYAVVDGDRCEVPREPDAYRPTTHFGQRLRERVPSSHRDRIIRECFETGVCRGTTPPSSVDRPGVAFQTFEFEARVTHGDFERVYSLVVGVVRDAFRGEPKHRALTIYQPEEPNL
jgi:hypothetical protein